MPTFGAPTISMVLAQFSDSELIALQRSFYASRRIGHPEKKKKIDNDPLEAFTPPPWLTETEAQGEQLAKPLGRAMERFRDGPEHGQERWVSILRSVLRRPLEDAVEAHRGFLLAKGFASGGARAAPAAQALQRAAEESVKEALEDTSDLRETLLQAEDDRGEDAEEDAEEQALTAAARFGLKQLLSAIHQKLTATSILRSVRDRFERKVTTAPGAIEGTGFTGRRQWHASPNGRHSVLDGVVVEAGKNWSLPDRTIDGRHYPAVKNVPFPRFNAKAAKEWSGSTSTISYEFLLPDGSTEWR